MTHSYTTDAVTPRRRRGRAAYTIGRLVLTTVSQGGHAPLADRCGGTILEGKHEGRAYWGRAILLTPWRRDKYGETLPQRAFVIGWMRPVPQLCNEILPNGKRCMLKRGHAGDWHDDGNASWGGAEEGVSTPAGRPHGDSE